MTTTAAAALTGLSIGVGASGTNYGDKLAPVKLTLQPTTTSVLISAQIVNGNGFYQKSVKPRIWFATTSFGASYTAAQGAIALQSNAQYLDILMAESGSGSVARDSALTVNTGGTIYVWGEIPRFLGPANSGSLSGETPAAATLNVNIVELP